MRNIDKVKQKLDQLDIIPKKAWEVYTDHLGFAWTASVNDLICNYINTKQVFDIVTGNVVMGKNLKDHFRVRDFHRAIHEILALSEEKEEMSIENIHTIYLLLMWNLDIEQADQIHHTEDLQKLIHWVNRGTSHPIDQAAILYGKLYKSKYFIESEMMANLLASWYLLTKGYTPIVIGTPDKKKFLEALEIYSRTKNSQLLVEIIEKAQELTLNLYLDEISEITRS
ncbi:hypothetical protein [Risungbinella massiliensis]|uniref:hypothetical protein n=1 Tax=Risungbinella massiliensis TaxID=1329796 RepID=UPI0005CBD6B6|nr:hypothetical protein [Risungbinella massiliensis]